MKIKYFAWIKDITKTDEEYLSNDEVNNTNKLKELLINKYPELKKHIDNEMLRFAINQEYSADNIELNSNDEIAIFPPVSGG